jgi:hypothetical protein
VLTARCCLKEALLAVRPLSYLGYVISALAASHRFSCEKSVLAKSSILSSRVGICELESKILNCGLRLNEVGVLELSLVGSVARITMCVIDHGLKSVCCSFRGSQLKWVPQVVCWSA